MFLFQSLCPSDSTLVSYPSSLLNFVAIPYHDLASSYARAWMTLVHKYMRLSTAYRTLKPLGLSAYS